MGAVMERSQLRLTLDSGMGGFYVWLLGLTQKARAREFITMARIGWAVTHGVSIAGVATGHVPGVAKMPAQATGGGKLPAGEAENPENRGPSKEAAVATFGRSFLTARPPA